MKIKATILWALYHIVTLVAISSLMSCASRTPHSTTDGETLKHPNKLLTIREQQESRYSARSDLMYEVLIGELSGQFGDIEHALQHYIIAANLTDDAAVAERATRIAMFAKDWVAGLRAASRWLELAGENLEVSQILGVLELRNGNVEGALPHFEAIMLVADASPAKGFSIIGAVLAREADFKASIQLLEELVNKHFENPYGHLAMASLAFRAREFQRALDASELALGFKPELVEARAMRAQALMNLEEIDQALQEMKYVVAETPGNRAIRMAYARMLLSAERYDEAAKEFAYLLAANPNDSDLIYTSGVLQLQQERYDAAAESFKHLVENDQRKDEGYYYLGRIAEGQDNLQAAIAEYENVEQGEYYLDAKARIASLYAKLDGVEKAQKYLADLRKQLSTPESIVEAYLIEGQLLYANKLYVVAMDVYSEGLQEFPGHSDLLYARALMAEEVNRIDLLEIDLRAILSEQPDHASALNALGYTLADHNFRVDEALGYIKRALEIRPNDPAIIDSMGWVQFRLGNYAEAESYLRKAYDLLEDAEIGGHLVELLWVQGNYDEARSTMNEVLRHFPDDAYLLKLQEKFK